MGMRLSAIKRWVKNLFFPKSILKRNIMDLQQNRRSIIERASAGIVNEDKDSDIEKPLSDFDTAYLNLVMSNMWDCKNASIDRPKQKDFDELEDIVSSKEEDNLEFVMEDPEIEFLRKYSEGTLYDDDDEDTQDWFDDEIFEKLKESYKNE